jgi:hypothetical protein
MRKIKIFSHLCSEQKRLRERRVTLEKAISNDVSRIRYTLKPLALARETVLSYAASVGRRLLSKFGKS